jgi:hypothetical protein
MKKVLGFVFGAFLLLGASQAAHAGSGVGYVCEIEDPSGGGTYWGSSGATYVYITTGPSCTGSTVGGGYFCSTGATSSSCTSSGYLRSEAQLQGLTNRLMQAAVANTKIYFGTDQNNNPMVFYFDAAGY